MRHLVIVPTYNEADNLGRLIDVLMDISGPTFHLLVVDDGSPDGTAQIAKSAAHQHPGRIFVLERAGKLGIGTAYVAGFQWAIAQGYDFVYEMDADFSHPPEALATMAHTLVGGEADLVVGSRYIGGVRVINWPMRRLILSTCASRYARLVTGLPILDTTAGFMGYRTSIFSKIRLDRIQAKGYFFQILMKYLVWKLGYRLKEIPIVFHERRDGQTKLSSGIFWEALVSVLFLPLGYRRYIQNTGHRCS